MIFGRRLGCVTKDCGPSSPRVDTIHEFVHCIQQLFVESAQMTVIPAKLAYSLNLPVWRRFVGAAEKALSLGEILFFLDSCSFDQDFVPRDSLFSLKSGKVKVLFLT